MARHRRDSEHPESQFTEVEQLLRDERHSATPVELDRIKLQAKRQASRRPARVGGSVVLGRRAVTLLIAVGLVVSGGGVAAAMGGKLHVLSHHHTGSAAWFQYKPPCPGTNKKGHIEKVSIGAGAAWKHQRCKPPCPSGKPSKAKSAGMVKGCPPPPCGKPSKARAAGVSHSCPPPPCGKPSKARAAGVSHSCPPPPCGKPSKARAAGVSHSCPPPDDQLQTPQTDASPPAVGAPAPNTGVAPAPVITPKVIHHVKKHKAKKKAKRHAKKKAVKRHVKKHAAKKH